MDFCELSIHLRKFIRIGSGSRKSENRGSGLGMDFARALNSNLNSILAHSATRQSRGHHLEKVVLDRFGLDVTSQ